MGLLPTCLHVNIPNGTETTPRCSRIGANIGSAIAFMTTATQLAASPGVSVFGPGFVREMRERQ